MSTIIGIDLGTTNTAVAVLQDGRPRMIEDDRGYKVLPSVVSARGEGRFIVGQAAHNLILTNPERTVYATKRLIGRRFDSPEVQRARERLRYQIKQGPDGMVLVQVGDEWMSPAEVAAVILQVARTITEKALGHAVDEAVVTVPAHFNHHQRQETMEAARMAGLRCDRLLNEPTAAALAYGHKKNVDRTIVIFDLGGGTFDLSVLKLSDGVYEVLATSGDTWLGGEDFDYRVVDHLADAFQARTGTDLRHDKNALQRVKDAAERAKCDLSFSDRTNVVIPHVVSGQNLEAVLTRSTLESLTADLVNRCLDITRSAVSDAGLPLSEIDEVVLVGGQTRMPRVREAVSGLFGREPSRSVHPEEAVAVGAAVHGAALADPQQPQTVLLDVTPFDLGIDAARDIFSTVIAKNARVPASETRTFATVHDNQTAVRITVRQGESRVATENEFLGEFMLDGLEAAPRMQTKVDVTFRLDNNGILHVSAVDQATRESRALSVRNYAERARGARMPTADEAAAEVARRAAGGGAAPAPAAVAKKPGLLASLFGTRTKAAPARTPKGAPAPAAAMSPAPAIDMAAVAPMEPPTIETTGEVDEAAAAMAEEEDLYGRDSATLGLGGARLPAASGVAEPTIIPPAGLDASDLFAGMDESDEDPVTAGRRRIAEAGVLGALGGPAPTSDPFGSDADDSVQFGQDLESGLTFEGMADDAEEGVLTDETGLGEAGVVGEGYALPAPDFTSEPESSPRPAFQAEVIPDEPPPPRPAAEPMRFAPEPPRRSTTAQAIQMSTPGLDPFSTGEGGAATGLPVDLFAYESDTAAVPASVASPFHDSPTSSGVPVKREAAPPARPAEKPFAPPPPPAARRPARLKMHYRERESFLVEYRGNLRRNGTFVKTGKPLAVGRECIFEVEAPGLTEPLTLVGIVTYISDGSTGEPQGMGVEYRLTEEERARLSALVAV
jgi:molecular chaperone DnaK